jgi:uncharacterized integral membrane protein
MLLSMIMAVILSIAAVFFANYNPTVVRVNIFGYAVSGPLGIVLVVAVGAGAVLGIVTMLPALLSRSWQLRRARLALEGPRDSSRPGIGKETPPE